MAEQFDRENLIITLCLKGSVPAVIPGQATPKAVLRPIVEISVRDSLGKWHQTEIAAEDFYSLIYKEVFPALGARLRKPRS
ncbi:MAG: hypothetical protein ACYDAL_16345 [Candidatus Dormibacteraceae bacterium]